MQQEYLPMWCNEQWHHVYIHAKCRASFNTLIQHKPTYAANAGVCTVSRSKVVLSTTHPSHLFFHYSSCNMSLAYAMMTEGAKGCHWTSSLSLSIPHPLSRPFAISRPLSPYLPPSISLPFHVYIRIHHHHHNIVRAFRSTTPTAPCNYP